MDILIHPGKLSGRLDVIPSKSMAHRFLICAAFAKKSIALICPETNRDIQATADCLRSFGADIQKTQTGYLVRPIENLPKEAECNCRESASTLRFLLPVAGALGISTTFRMEGRLSQRPLSPLWEEMERMGCTLSRPTENSIHCEGKLRPGNYTIAGNVSSQFISGLLFALNLLGQESSLNITGKAVSAPYAEMTRAALALFADESHLPRTIHVEGDWSNGAFWLAANELGSYLTVQNLKQDSLQGDRICTILIPALQKYCRIAANDFPDLVPVLSIVAAARHGAEFTGIQHLRTKESDRIASILAMIQNLGGIAEAQENKLTIFGTGLTGGTVDSFSDHRIAMSAAIASTVCKEPVIIRNAECVSKSYPHFWEEFRRLGGKYEQYIR